MSTQPSVSIAAPGSVVWSYRLYIVGAVLGLIGAVVTFIALPAAISAGTDAANRALQGRSTNGVDVASATAGLAVGGAILSAVITLAFSILTIVFARKMLAGRNWARIVLAVFAALQIFGVLGSLGVGALHFVVVLVALILSFVPTSNAWFREQRVEQPVTTAF
ncbi:hypothetical protein [Amnibacterium kyonggiense]